MWGMSLSAILFVFSELMLLEFLFSVDRNKYQIQIPLPPKIDASVTMMQVEEKPDVTYSDVGGCKEQIEKLREVVETPLLSVRANMLATFSSTHSVSSPNGSSTLVSTHPKVYFSSAPREPARPSALVQSRIERTPHSSV